MKKIVFITLMLAAGVFVAPTVSAQSYTTLQYTMGVPFGGLKEHISEISWRGITFEYQKEVAPSISVGVNFAWSTFYEEMPYGSYTDGTATLTGHQYRYDNLFPMMVNAQYRIGSSTIVPYVGIGVGTIADLRNTDMGLWTIENTSWHFMLSPEAGFLFDVANNTSIKLSAMYNSAFKTKEVDAFGDLNISLGLVFNSW